MNMDSTIMYEILHSKYPVVLLAENDLNNDELNMKIIAENDNDNQQSLYIYGFGNRLSYNIFSDSTSFIMSFARFITAKGTELLQLNYLDNPNQQFYVEATNVMWETRAMRLLQETLFEQLSRYTAQQNDPRVFFDEKYATAMSAIQSEREVCLFWIIVIEISITLMEMKSIEALTKIKQCFTNNVSHEIDFIKFRSKHCSVLFEKYQQESEIVFKDNILSAKSYFSNILQPLLKQF